MNHNMNHREISTQIMFCSSEEEYLIRLSYSLTDPEYIIFHTKKTNHPENSMNEHVCLVPVDLIINFMQVHHLIKRDCYHDAND